MIIEDRKQVNLMFCKCYANDQVRLIHAGYIGGSPDHPVSAITIRLLRFFHILWKYCCIGYQPFALALTEYIDPGNPIFLAKGGETVIFFHFRSE